VIVLLILLIMLSVTGLVMTGLLLRRFTEHLRVQEERLLRMERLVTDMFQEKTIGMVRQMQGRIRVEHEAQRGLQVLPDPAWDQVETLFEEEDRTFSTALRILLEARRMYEERMKLLDKF